VASLARSKGSRNVALSLSGNLVPLVVAAVSFPILANRAGADRLALLGLAWTIIGYLGLLDLGFARVVVRRVALIRTRADSVRESGYVRKILLLLTLWTVPLSAIGAWFFPIRIMLPAGVPETLTQEAILSIRIVVGTLPLVLVAGVLRGVLEGRLMFGRANILKAVFGSWNFGAPALVSLIAPRLPEMVAALAFGRVLGVVAHYAVARKVLSLRLNRTTRDVIRIAPLVTEGGWLTVSGIIAPLMVTFDRFAVSSQISLESLAHYLIPQEVALRLLTIPFAIATTAYPMVSQAVSVDDQGSVSRIQTRGVLAAAAICLPMCVLFAGVAEPLMSWWLGPDFADKSGDVAAILAVGLFANCLAQIPFAAIQAVGRSDITGKIHLAELPLYFAGLWALIPLGIRGVAVAWSVRAVVDAASLFGLSRRVGAGVVGRDELKAIWFGVLLVGGTAMAALSFKGSGLWLLVSLAIMGATMGAKGWLSRIADTGDR
jgi:O-antigen/teichoic acid export membrane protein